MKKRLLFFVWAFVLVACKKSGESCWQVYDGLGNEMGVVCGKTEPEIQATYGPLYDKANASKFCWKVYYNNGTVGYPENLTEKMVAYWFGNSATRIEKVACGYCQRWLTREKGVLKLTGSFAYKPTRVEQYCGDTCTALYAGRVIVLRETTDSIIYHEFMQKWP